MAQANDWRREQERYWLADERELARQEKEAARLQREEERERAAQYLEDRRAEATAQQQQVDERMRDLNEILQRALKRDVCPLRFDRMKQSPRTVPLNLGADAVPLSSPEWADFAPPPPSFLSSLFGGRARYENEVGHAEAAFAEAVERHRRDESARERRVRDARTRQADEQTTANAEAAKQQEEIDSFAKAVRNRDRHASSRYFQLALDGIKVKPALRGTRRAGYVPESSLLAIEWWLPDVDVVPRGKAHRYVKTRDAIDSTPRPPNEVRAAYQRAIAQIALVALRHAFQSDPDEMVETVVFNGMVKSVDPATGQTVRPCLITLRATREHYSKLVLENVDPVKCVQRHFAADVSPHPEELQPVNPVLQFEMADPRIVDPVDILSEIDKRPNLIDLTPKEFEQFIHNLFTLMGLDTKLFRADGDGGVDCIAYDPNPVFGGKFVIQAKLYTKTVQPTHVRDLYGTIHNEGATKGILITTSGYGPTSYEFANGKPLTLIDGSGLLALCAEHDIPARILYPAGKHNDRRGRRS